MRMAISRDVTLLDVFQAVREAAANEQETLVTMVHLLTSGQVRLSAEALRAMQHLAGATHAVTAGGGPSLRWWRGCILG
jgi:hypothetical protein